MANTPQPKVIFLDAVGTLFGVAGSVGEIYADLAQHYGVIADPTTLNQAFFRTFKAAPEMAFPGSDPATVPEQEYLWWRVLAQQTFSSAGVLDRFVDFDSFFADLYAHFATATPWVLYPDVPPALERWRRRGIALGVISNFDTRLYAVLEALDLINYFSSITISSEAGAAKPDPLIFATALQKHGCEASQAWHVGDSKADDFEGAKAAGLQGILVKR
ncbi:HAD family hydrolase [Nodosilinea sp. E11]|uniref:HAD-IA family hydrolase n=1 Tax=Nodosilinea sp. E11 TaxID=3037479 RepID=UPI0029350E63|nr:HAD family hydrolase [Nodosilinea sp. E11]WOD38331.1 HAD family hydrolase [Nodosilinea sp. E11]